MRPSLILPFLLAALLMLATAREARADTYTVRECWSNSPVNYEYEATELSIPDPGPFDLITGNACSDSGESNALKIQPRPGTGSSRNQLGRLSFTTPLNVAITRVTVAARMLSSDGNVARLMMTNRSGTVAQTFASGTSLGGGQFFDGYEWSNPGGYAHFAIQLGCESHTCATGSDAKVWVRNLEMQLRDERAPRLTLEGEIFDGWVKGDGRVRWDAADAESGVARSKLSVNQKEFATEGNTCARIGDTGIAMSPQPCGTSLETTSILNTQEDPFVSGDNTIEICARDYSMAAYTCRSRTARIDNRRPEIGFEASAADDPELFVAHAADEHSGLGDEPGQISFRRVGTQQWSTIPTTTDGGTLAARIDSRDYPSGRYEFKAEIEDAVGNRGSTGPQGPFEFPLREIPAVTASLGNGSDAQVVKYREPGTVSGRLLDPSGAPLPGEAVTVVQRFEDGALVDDRRNEVITDGQGRYSYELPGGPSRNVDVFYEGSPVYQGATAEGLDFDSRGAASLRISKRKVKAGGKIRFRGQVGRHRARVPAGGKLVEVQVRNGRRWDTLLEAQKTDQRGRLKVAYKFRRFYTQKATFTFRLKSTSEQGWPFVGSARSSRQKVTVVPRK